MLLSHLPSLRPRSTGSPTVRPSLVALCLALAGPSVAPGQGYVLWQLNGAGAGYFFGSDVAAAGDIDGDGSPDVIVGAYLAAPLGFIQAGQVEVCSGPTGSNLFTINGPGTDQELGASVAGVGDLDGDGFDDFAAGAPGCCPAWPGFARVYSGATGTIFFTFNGTTPGDRLGYSIAPVGDMNGDGVPEIVVGAPVYYIATVPPAPGYVKVYSGANGSVLLTLVGITPADRFGAAVSGVADMTGDGVPEVLVGAPRGFSDAGYIRVFSGAGGGSLLTVTGAAPAGRFGTSVADAGDVNGDSVPDLLVGAPVANPAGQARVLSGATGSTLFTFSGAGIYDRLGASVAGAGDANLDGFPDLLVGAPQWTCCPYSSGGPGYAKIFSGATGGVLFTFVGSTFGSEFGTSVARAGDVNLDGLGDFVLGAPRAGPGGVTSAIGQARVVSTAGIPPGSYTFGSGCPGSSGAVPVIQTAGAPGAVVGNPNLSIVLSRALPNASALLIIGVSNTFWTGLGIALPVNLSPLGFPACALNVSAEVQIPASTTSNGIRFVPMPVPPTRALFGQAVYLQWFVLDPPGAMTRGLRIAL